MEPQENTQILNLCADRSEDLVYVSRHNPVVNIDASSVANRCTCFRVKPITHAPGHKCVYIHAGSPRGEKTLSKILMARHQQKILIRKDNYSR